MLRVQQFTDGPHEKSLQQYLEAGVGGARTGIGQKIAADVTT